MTLKALVRTPKPKYGPQKQGRTHAFFSWGGGGGGGWEKILTKQAKNRRKWGKGKRFGKYEPKNH